MGKIRFGEKWGVEYTNPSLQNYAHVSKSESIIIFDTQENHDTNARQCFGIGKVMRVFKGEKLDIIYMNFGRKYNRKIVVFHNHARRQVYTLKRGQLASIYGYFKTYVEDKQTKAVLYALGFQAWFVPKTLDIKEYNTDTLDELTKENETSMLNFLDEILGDDNNEL